MGGSGSWWPAELGSPNGSGGQNNVRYAYFANARRLAIDVGGNVTVYDTLDHQIGGVSQQQGIGGSVTLSSQYGTVDVASLPVVSVNGTSPQQPASQPNSPQPYSSQPNSSQQFVPNAAPQFVPQGQPSGSQGTGNFETDIFQKIERLAELQQKGILSSEEFATKKSELLSRL
jgi:hypothetical protein